MKIEIRPGAYDPWNEVADFQVASDRLMPGSYGACAVFVGTMRDFNEGDEVNSMVLEHYPGMTENQLTELADTTTSKYSLLDMLVLHRVGEIHPNDPIVLVAAWSVHRAAAFDACRDMMESLKSKATFWKKEKLTDRDRWVEKNTPG
ncbi:MAG: molybdenum cofactor biosynthesis protein MoaE [bacterium]